VYTSVTVAIYCVNFINQYNFFINDVTCRINTLYPIYFACCICFISLYLGVDLANEDIYLRTQRKVAAKSQRYAGSTHLLCSLIRSMSRSTAFPSAMNDSSSPTANFRRNSSSGRVANLKVVIAIQRALRRLNQLTLAALVMAYPLPQQAKPLQTKNLTRSHSTHPLQCKNLRSGFPHKYSIQKDKLNGRKPY